jgi:hypothetical protein
MKKKREETITTIVKTTSSPLPIVLKEEGGFEFEGEEEFNQKYPFNRKQCIRLSLPLQRENTHDYRKQICLGQSEFLSHEKFSMKYDSGIVQSIPCDDSFRKTCLKINDEKRLICPDSGCVYSDVNILSIPNDILGIIITFTDIIGKHVLLFVNKYFHNIVHSIVVSNLLLPKNFYEYNYNYIAAEIGDISLFDWVMFTFHDVPNTNHENTFVGSSELDIMARNNNLDLMKYIKKFYNYKWSEKTCYEAASGGHLGVLKWLFENGCRWDDWTCAKAASNGHLEVLKWARENDCPWDWKTCYYAAEGGHFKILKWARKKNCPWNSETTYAAAKRGHFEMLKWAEKNECDCDTGISQGAAEGGRASAARSASSRNIKMGKKKCSISLDWS